MPKFDSKPHTEFKKHYQKFIQEYGFSIIETPIGQMFFRERNGFLDFFPLCPSRQKGMGDDRNYLILDSGFYTTIEEVEKVIKTVLDGVPGNNSLLYRTFVLNDEKFKASFPATIEGGVALFNHFRDKVLPNFEKNLSKVQSADDLNKIWNHAGNKNDFLHTESLLVGIDHGIKNRVRRLLVAYLAKDNRYEEYLKEEMGHYQEFIERGNLSTEKLSTIRVYLDLLKGLKTKFRMLIEN